ncbi:MAG: helix-turn-helix transcriptional regulator [Actinomycetota bacterium]
MSSIELLIRRARRSSGASLREVADRAGTSHSTLSSYEQGHKQPSLDTLERVVAATGHHLELTVVPRYRDQVRRGEELEAVLDLADEFPSEPEPTLRYPIFGRR